MEVTEGEFILMATLQGYIDHVGIDCMTTAILLAFEEPDPALAYDAAIQAAVHLDDIVKHK